MRISILVFVALFELGCGNGNGNQGSNSDQGVSSTDMATAAAGDMSAATASGCDVAAQTGCGTGQKCIPAAMGNQLTGTCVANGTAAEGQPCTPAAGGGNTLNDNCVAGTICDNDGAGSVNLCRKVCTADGGCGGNQKCGVVYTRKWGLCLSTCNEFSADCGANNDCSVPFDDISSTQQMSVGFFVCKKTGTGALYANCNQDSDCGSGLACDFGNNWCAQACDNTHACTQPPATDGGTVSVTCQAYSNLSNGGGFCQ